MKKLVVHIGSPKTGTTSIQEMLFKNAKYLRDKGINYPKSLHNHNVSLVPLVREDPTKLPFYKRNYTATQIPSIVEDYYEKWMAAFKDNKCDIFIISSENLYLNSKEAALRLRDFVSPFFDHISIVVFIRHPLEFICSLIQQRVKNGLTNKGLEEHFHSVMKSKVKYSSTIKPWQELYGSCCLDVRPYDKKIFVNGDLISDFFDAIGRPDIKSHELNISNYNESIGMNSVLFLAEYNKRYPVLVNGQPNRKRGLGNQNVPEKLFAELDDRKFSLDLKFNAEQAAIINEEIDFVNSLFKSNYQFQKVKSSNEQMEFPRIENVPVSFYLDLFNEYNKESVSHFVNPDKILKAYVDSRKRWIAKLKNVIAYLYIVLVKKGISSFDSEYYLYKNPDTKYLKINPFMHYHFFGAHEGRNPNSNFNTNQYILQNPSIITTGVNPILHQERNMKSLKSKISAKNIRRSAKEVKLVMTLLVRDGEDIIRENIDYHLAQGVDFIIATDNLSKDSTSSILKEYERKGKLLYIREDDDSFRQAEWVTRMARLAASEYKADWVINNDMDEFWWPLDGNLKDTFARIDGFFNTVIADRFNYVYVGYKGNNFYEKMIYKDVESKNTLGKSLPAKTAHIGFPDIDVMPGNHKVRGLKVQKPARGIIEVYHFPVRSDEQLHSKVINGNSSQKEIRTWRKLHNELEANGNLNRYLDNVYYDKKRLQKEIAEGKIVINVNLRNYINSMRK